LYKFVDFNLLAIKLISELIMITVRLQKRIANIVFGASIPKFCLFQVFIIPNISFSLSN